jgi:hypothetical protein
MPLITQTSFWRDFRIMEKSWTDYGTAVNWRTPKGPCVFTGGQPLPPNAPRPQLRCWRDASGVRALAWSGAFLPPHILHLPGIVHLIDIPDHRNVLVFHPMVTDPGSMDTTLFRISATTWWHDINWAPLPALQARIRQEFQDLSGTKDPVILPHATPLLLKFLDRKRVVQ